MVEVEPTMAARNRLRVTLCTGSQAVRRLVATQLSSVQIRLCAYGRKLGRHPCSNGLTSLGSNRQGNGSDDFLGLDSCFGLV